MRYKKKRVKAVISSTAVDQGWTVPKARGVKINRKRMPFSMMASMYLCGCGKAEIP
jgi:hypothetical protein